MSRTLSSDFLIEVAKGNIPNHSSILKFGENPDIDTASGFETIWDGGGIYVPPTQARIHDVVSTVANDAGTTISSGTATGGSATTLTDTGATFVSDGVVAGDTLLNDSEVEFAGIVSVTETEITVLSMLCPNEGGSIGTVNAAGDTYRVIRAAGTGVALFHVLGLNASFAQIDEFVVMNGTTNVPTINTWIRQYRARVFVAGSANGAVGIITSTAQTDGTVTCQIIDGNNQTLMAVYTVPISIGGKLVDRVYVLNWWGSLVSKIAGFSIANFRGGQLDQIGYIAQRRGLATTGTSTFNYPYPIAAAIPPGTDLWIEADSSANNMKVGAGFDLLIITLP